MKRDRKAQKRAYYLANKDKFLEQAKDNYVRNREKRIAAATTRSALVAKNNPEILRNQHLKRTYGITLADEQRMLEEQGNKCAICHRAESDIHPKSKRTRRLNVDHDHATGKVRGLLCSRCNTAIGLFGENLEVIVAASEYLRRHV